MNPSEQSPHSGRDNVGKPLQNVTTTAQVFANYVFMPAGRRPNGDTRPAGLHGSAFLVFSDEVSKKIQLRTGYASRITRHPILDARENRRDEVVSSQSEISQVMAVPLSIATIVIGSIALLGFILYVMNH